MTRHVVPSPQPHRRPEPPAQRRRRWPVAVVTAAALALTAGPAIAFFTSSASGAGNVTAGTLYAPASVTPVATPGSGDVALTWAAPTLPVGAVLSGYYLTRTGAGGPAFACGSDPANLLAASPRACTDSAVAAGSYTYTVTAVLAGWTATSPSSGSVTVAPDINSPTMTLATTSPVNAYLGPNGVNYRLYFRNTLAGSFGLAATVTDTGAGPASAAFPAVATATWTHPAQTVTTGTGSAPAVTYTSAYSWAAGSATPPVSTITGKDAAGNVTTRTVTFRADTSVPTGGTLVVNGSTSNTAGTATSNNTTGTYAITTLTQYVEVQSTTQSGLASSGLVRTTAPLVGGVCGTFGSPTPIGGAAPITETGMATGCYRYTLTGVDNLGNTASRATTVRVDLTAPTVGALTVNATAATSGGTTSASPTTSWTITRTDFTDGDSGLTSSTLVRTQATLTNGVCGTFGTSTTLTGAPAQSGTARTCYRYVLKGTNAYGLTSSLTTTVVVGPYVTSVALVDGSGVAGRAGAGDTVVITFADTIKPSTFCSTWGASGDQSLAADNQVTVSLNQVTAADTLTVSATGCTFNFGSINLGSTAYTTATATFLGAGANRSTITWTAATSTLTITLGATASAALGTVASSAVVYTPSTAVQSTSGVALGGTFTTPVRAQL